MRVLLVVSGLVWVQAAAAAAAQPLVDTAADRVLPRMSVTAPRWTLQQPSGGGADGLRARPVERRERAPPSEQGGPSWLRAQYRRFVTTTALTVVGALLLILVVQRAALRSKAATGAATALPLSLGQWLLHAVGFTLLAGACAGALLAHQLGQVNAGYEQKLGMLVGLAAACSALAGPVFLMRSPLRAVSLPAQLLFAGLFIAVALAEGFYAVLSTWQR